MMCEMTSSTRRKEQSVTSEGEEEMTRPMNLEEAMEKVGSTGKFQLLLNAAVSVGVVPMACSPFVMSFAGDEPDHHCQLPAGASMNDSIPLITDAHGLTRYDQCHMFSNSSQFSLPNSLSNFSLLHQYVSDHNNHDLANITRGDVVQCNNGWDFQTEQSETTISTEWSLVCNNEYLVPLVQTIYFIGLMFGSFVCGSISDRYGRKRVFVTAFFLATSTGLFTSFSTSYTMFILLRFLVGVWQVGMGLVCTVLLCEMFPAEKRFLSQFLSGLAWPVGMLLMTLLAYYIRNWRQLYAMTFLCFLPFGIFYLWWLPESLHWQVAHGQLTAAERTLERAAKMNGTTLPRHCLTASPQRDNSNKQNGEVTEALLPHNNTADMEVGKRGKKRPAAVIHAAKSMLDICQSAKLLPRTLIMFMLWITNSLVYWAISMNTATYAGDKYVNFVISALVELPSNFIALWLLRYSRRKTQAIAFVVAGVPLLATAFIPTKTVGGTNLHPLITALAMLGKFGISLSWTIILLFTPEVYPTVVRNAGLGVANAAGKLGAMMAPFAGKMSKHYPAAPPAILGCMSLVCAVLSLFLPETNNLPMAECLEDLHDEGRRGKELQRPAHVLHELVHDNEMFAIDSDSEAELV